jgi:hypothetical protein
MVTTRMEIEMMWDTARGKSLTFNDFKTTMVGEVVYKIQEERQAALEELYATICAHCGGQTKYTELHSERWHTEPGVPPTMENYPCAAASLRLEMKEKELMGALK